METGQRRKAPRPPATMTSLILKSPIAPHPQSPHPYGMELRGESVALYGRFSPGARDGAAPAGDLRRQPIARDFTRRSTVLIIGALATSLIDGGQLASRLEAARTR